ncbi:uncharacterized protein LOC111049268 [Nilaparvata lugens]|uniref:uncharacterized protein LOC111049268 n=1 Tax=Nilaparvata lugens TaxID=108931 RepID=UPI000B97F343|nr:uncharacterized protein LOC111049268 [Nilaparvata lugens]XP_022190997.1 uncharacterized protein LOC111049268 [Nilaparvata lugens]
MKTRSATRKMQSVLLENKIGEGNICSRCHCEIDKTYDFTIKESLLCWKCYEKEFRLNSSNKDPSKDLVRCTEITSIRTFIDSLKCRPVLLLLLLAACWCCYLIVSTIIASLFKTNSGNMKCKDAESILTDVLLLRTEFSRQYDETWFDFAAGIDSVVNSDPARPTTFLLLHEDGARAVARLLSERIASLAAGCMNGEVLQLEAEQLGQQLDSDGGRLLTEYRDKIHVAKVVFIDNFHRLPAELAKQLHHLCDFHQPVVGRVVYVFVMRVDHLPTETNKTVAAEEALYELWAPHLHHYLLDPLITRITGNVIRVAR